MRKLFFCLLAFAAMLLAANFKLYLKDGNYHLVREYKVEKDKRRAPEKQPILEPEPQFVQASISPAVSETVRAVYDRPQSPGLGDIAIPDFYGKSLRQVTEECLKAGLRLQSIGSGAAVQQLPLPGTSVRAGSRVRVRFSSKVERR